MNSTAGSVKKTRPLTLRLGCWPGSISGSWASVSAAAVISTSGRRRSRWRFSKYVRGLLQAKTNNMLKKCFFIFPLAFAIAMQAASADPCSGLLTDKANHPMTALAKPALLQAVTDPQFGTTIRRISSTVNNGIVVPMYSPIPAWNVDETYLILYHTGSDQYAGEHVLYDGKTYQFLKVLPLESPTDLEQVHWDPANPDVLYYPSNYNGGRRFMRYRVSTNQNEMLRDFSTAPTSCASGTVLGGDSHQYMSWEANNKVIGLQCGNKKFAYNIGTDTVYAIQTLSSSGVPGVAPSGNLMLWDGKVYDTQTFTLQRTLSMAVVDEHSSNGRLANGTDVHNVVSFDDAEPGSLVSYDLTTGARKVVIGPATGYPYPPSGTHISSVAIRNPGYVALSIIGTGTGQSLLDNELVIADLNTNRVCRAAHHHSKESVDYWGEPHATISPSGTRILFGSDWGGTSVDTYVVELPSYQP